MANLAEGVEVAATFQAEEVVAEQPLRFVQVASQTLDLEAEALSLDHRVTALEVEEIHPFPCPEAEAYSLPSLHPLMLTRNPLNHDPNTLTRCLTPGPL